MRISADTLRLLGDHNDKIASAWWFFVFYNGWKCYASDLLDDEPIEINI